MLPKSRPPRSLRVGCFIFAGRVIYLEQFPFYHITRLMPSFNTLFTHGNVCAGEENEWTPACRSDLLYHSLTIWIANRTIYHGALIYSTGAAQVSVPQAYGNGVHVMKLKRESLCLKKKVEMRRSESIRMEPGAPVCLPNTGRIASLLIQLDFHHVGKLK